MDTLPPALKHDTDNDVCWCAPEIKQPCPEHPEPYDMCPPSCFRCAGVGLVEVYDDVTPKIIIHRDL